MRNSMEDGHSLLPDLSVLPDPDVTSLALVALITAAAAGGLPPAPARAQTVPPLAGVWTINRPLSEFPPDIGFNPSWMTASSGDDRNAAVAGAGAVGRRRRSGIHRTFLRPPP